MSHHDSEELTGIQRRQSWEILRLSSVMDSVCKSTRATWHKTSSCPGARWVFIKFQNKLAHSTRLPPRPCLTLHAQEDCFGIPPSCRGRSQSGPEPGRLLCLSPGFLTGSVILLQQLKLPRFTCYLSAMTKALGLFYLSFPVHL